MLVFRGGPAWSGFRLQRLAEKCNISANDISNFWAYFIHPEKELEAKEIRRIEVLLDAQQYDYSQAELITTPRVGTISPWSSKATEIFQACGLHNVLRIEKGLFWYSTKGMKWNDYLDKLIDPMTESAVAIEDITLLFQEQSPAPLKRVSLQGNAVEKLQRANQELGLSLSLDEITYLVDAYKNLERDPTDVELLMFAQANSEHCRHKIFNASWEIDGETKDDSLFSMIKSTYNRNPFGILSAYHDNAAVIRGYAAARFYPDQQDHYQYKKEPIHIAIKVETHNHPTAISPHPGAGTGAGGEIRDEGATGRGGKPKAGLCGFSVSDLHIPNLKQPWESNPGQPDRLASALQIMLDGPIGAAAFNNEFGRPNLCGYFRTFCQLHNNEYRGYHKPIMIAGGYGNIRPQDVQKNTLAAGDALIVLGGPAMLIGLGGGSASSISSGTQSQELDFASVQRANPEMQRRCQEVIDRCWASEDNPIVSIHDVGAGGLSNAFPELVHDSGKGGTFSLRDIPNAEPGMSPMAIWCNEAQERYVLGIKKESLGAFTKLCERENAPFAVVGFASEETNLIIKDKLFNNHPVDMPLEMLLGKPPKMHRKVQTIHTQTTPFDFSNIELKEAIHRVLSLPTVASKSFLITIADRTITGMVARDQFVGPWQIPVADVAITTSSYTTLRGEAMAMGERTPIALLDAPAAGRMAIGEAITNISAAPISHLNDIKMSANWMVASAHPGEGAKLYATVKTVACDLCAQLGMTIPVGKDSMSMQAQWEDKKVTAPLSLIISAFAPVKNCRHQLTPELQKGMGSTELWLIDLGQRRNRLGGSALAYVYEQMGTIPPDVDDANLLKNFFSVIQFLNKEGLLLAYHDRSDGGLLACICEMAFCSNQGIEIDVCDLGYTPMQALFSEELGAVIQIRSADRAWLTDALEAFHIISHSHCIGHVRDDKKIVIRNQTETLHEEDIHSLLASWTAPSFALQSLRDNPACAQEERQNQLDPTNPGLSVSLSFDVKEDICAPFINKQKPAVAILREQGVNGQLEMAAAFDAAGFTSIDVHMNDLRNQTYRLHDFVGLVACGGFSYGDVLGAGGGWAKSILFDEYLKDEFQAFFENPDHFSLGVCNGCQMLSQLKGLIPGAQWWPTFERNLSEQFEARLSLVEVLPSPSIFFQGMAGSKIPIPIAHGEGRVVFQHAEDALRAQGHNPLRYIDNYGNPADQYPSNPNGSPQGLTALTSLDGRCTIMMPHPERAWRSIQFSWHPRSWMEEGPWLRLFRNARTSVG